MSKTPFRVVPEDGMVFYGNYPHQNPNSFARLINCRLDQSRRRIEQTLYFKSKTTWTAGTYYSGGSQTEPAGTASSLAFFVGSTSYMFGRYTARVAGVQVQVVRQSSSPSGTTATKRCMVVINSYTGLNLTLGSSLDIEIDGATTFKWRKNGGAYTLAVPITTAGVSIDGGNATVYFLASAGFTVADAWVFTRTDYLTDGGGTGYAIANDWYYQVYNGKIYFLDYSGRLMVYENSGIRTVGYKPIYGTGFVIFESHIIVTDFSETYTATVTNIIGNGDNLDLENFLPTDTNEADVYTLSGGTSLGNSVTGLTGFRGIFIIRGALYVMTWSDLWVTGYAGLPTPFSFKQFLALSRPASSTFRPIVVDSGVYLSLVEGLYHFDGGQLKSISDKIKGCFTPTQSSGDYAAAIVWGGYDALRNEVYFYSSTIPALSSSGASDACFLVYQEVTDSWYIRAASFTNVCRSMAQDETGLICLPYSLGIMVEAASGTTLLQDYGSGAAFFAPQIVSQVLRFDTVGVVKDINAMYLDAFYSATATGSYGTTGIRVDLYSKDSSSQLTSWAGLGNETWVSASTPPNGFLSIRGNGRNFYFSVIPQVTTNKATLLFEFFGMTLDVLNINGGVDVAR